MRDQYATWLCAFLQPGGDVDVVPEDVMWLHEHVPRFMPMRNSSRWPRGVPTFQVRMASWKVTANQTARVALGNSARNPSPVCLTIRAPCSAIPGSMMFRRTSVCSATIRMVVHFRRRSTRATISTSTAAVSFWSSGRKLHITGDQYRGQGCPSLHVAGRTLAPLRGLAMSTEELLRRGDGNWSLGIAG